MRRWGPLLGLVLMFACSAPSVEPQPSPPELIVYELSGGLSSSGWRVEVLLPRSLAGARICLPSLGTRRGEQLRWRNARSGQALIRPHWDAEGCFRVPPLGAELELSYDVTVEAAERAAWRAIALSPRSSANTLVFPGESLFLEFPERLRDGLGAQLLLNVDRGRVFSTLGEGEQLWAPSNEQLLRSMVLLSDDFRHVRLETATGSVRVAVEPTFCARQSRSTALSAENSALQALSGDRLARAGVAADGLDDGCPVPSLEGSSVDQANALPLFFDDLSLIVEQLDSWVRVSPIEWRGLLLFEAGWDRSAREGFARGASAILQVGRDVIAQREELAVLAAHELFHGYNGGRLRFAEAEHVATGWFREGATSYVSLLAARHAGILDDDGFFRRLAEHANGANEPVLEFEQPVHELSRSRAAYDRGVMLCLALDMLLRDVSDGQRSFRSFWHFLSSSSAWQQEQTNQSLRAALSDFAGVELSAFFNDFVLGTQPIPVAALMSNAGVASRSELEPVAEFGFELDYQLEAIELRLGRVLNGSVAHRAGLRQGDLLWPTAQSRFDGSTDAVEFEYERGGERRFVRLFPKVEYESVFRFDWAEPGASCLMRAILEDRIVPTRTAQR